MTRHRIYSTSFASVYPHYVAKAEKKGRTKDEVRVLKMVARTMDAFERLLEALQGTAAAERVGRIAVRCQADYAEAYLRLIGAGYRVHWTDLRMILHGFAQVRPRQGVVLSNWEI